MQQPLAVLPGSLRPDGAAIKQSAVSPQLLKHRGRALVFDRIEDYNPARESDDLPVDEITVLVLRNAGPKAIRACRRSATSPCRGSCWSGGSPTWCASPTRA